MKDPRAKVYIQKFGRESWELDALEPKVFRSLIESSLSAIREDKPWTKDVEERAHVTEQLKEIAKDWEQLGANEAKLLEAAAEVEKLTKQVESLKRRAKKKGRKPDA